MNNFEQIDDYLTNRLSPDERNAFERQLESDSSLKSDVDLQRNILEGVRRARVNELKALLNNVPVPGTGFSSGLMAGKIAASVVIAGVIGTAAYFYLKPVPEKESDTINKLSTEQEVSKGPAEKTITPPAENSNPAKGLATSVETPKNKEAQVRKEEPRQQAVAPRKIEVTDPSDELVNDSKKEGSSAEKLKTTITASSIAVETRSSKKYNFNYQFSGGKLILYGPFDKSLYEILEIHGDNNILFLVYKEQYYLLDEKQEVISELNPIKDVTLIRKLREYRGKN